MLTINRHSRRNVTVRMTEADLGPILSLCPACGRSGNTRVLPIQTDPDIHWTTCNTCRCSYADRQPTPEFLARYYGTYYAGEKVRVHISPKRLVNQILKRCRFNKTNLRILDFGGGDGAVALAVAAQLKERGLRHADITVADYNDVPNPSIPDFCRLSYVKELKTLEKSEGFDLVIASAVLEHVPDLHTVLPALWRLLAPSGWFYARTPYVVPLASFLKKWGVTFDLNYPAHLFDLGGDFWSSSVSCLSPDLDVVLAHGGPSLVETLWRSAPLRTAAAYTLKAPYWILGQRYGLVGGWECFMRRPMAGEPFERL